MRPSLRAHPHYSPHFRRHLLPHHRASTPPLHLRYRSQLLVAAALIAALALFGDIWLQPPPSAPASNAAASSAMEADQDLAPME
ncbi:MAG: hypothetical protein RR855_14700 [Comamonas sp.]